MLSLASFLLKEKTTTVLGRNYCTVREILIADEDETKLGLGLAKGL